MSARGLWAALITLGLWSSLALLADRMRHVPPLLSAGLALMIGGLVGAWRREAWRAPLPVYAIGVSGLLGYHALLFAAFALAPSVAVNLLNYLWPPLLVVLSPVFLREQRLRAWPIAGAVLGFAGAALLVGGSRAPLASRELAGYACAVAAAFVWAVYSLSCRRLAALPTSAVAACCLLAGASAMLLHHALEGSTALHGLTGADLTLLLGLGLGPMGVAFLTWDLALRSSDPRSLGALAYLTPLLSTLLLAVVNGHAIGRRSALAMLAILAGAVLGNMPEPHHGWRRTHSRGDRPRRDTLS